MSWNSLDNEYSNFKAATVNLQSRANQTFQLVDCDFIMNQLKNKVALITGGNSGIGLATAKLFKQEGAEVIITARSSETFEIAMKEFGEEFKIIQCDVSRVSEIEGLFEKIKDDFGHLDIVVANAGISQIKPLSNFDEQSYDLVFDTNVKSVFYTIQQAAPLLKDGGSVVITASAASWMGFPGGSVYGATKAALNAFARHFAGEFAQRKIRFNSVSPSLIETPIQAKFAADKETLEAFRAAGSRNPAGRMGEADEVAESILFLASDRSSYINGIELYVDGGGKAVPSLF